MQLDLLDPEWHVKWINGSHNRVCHCRSCLLEIALQARHDGEPKHWNYELQNQKHDRRVNQKKS